MDLIQLDKLIIEKINHGEELHKKLNTFEHIEGVKKVQRKIWQELKFLKKNKSTNTLKLQHLQCSNLTYYNFLVENIFSCTNLKYVEYPLHVSNRVEPLKIDIVCDNGTTWIKVIARNDVVHERAKYGAKSILDHAEEFVQAANENLCFFRIPLVIFRFASQINPDIVTELEQIGVRVCQKDENLNSVRNEDEEKIQSIIDKLNNKFNSKKGLTLLNLDTSTMLAYISELTNGGDNSIFKEPILNEQAECERKTHVKWKLEKLFENKKIICCETASTSVKEIVSMLGGPKEKSRLDELLKRIEILPDDDKISEELIHVNISGKIKQRSLIIFSFGLYHKAVTVTSNGGFLRSVKMQGLDVPAFVHEARALTELKEISKLDS